MALRTRTVEYSFPTNTATLAAATRRDLAAINVDIAETSSRTFRNVTLEVHFRGDETVAASMTSWLLGIKLGAAAFSDVTTTFTVTNSGDQQAWTLRRDVTSYFQTNYGAGTTQTCQVGISIAALATANHSAKLLITYEFDDASATTRTRTVRIPLESSTAQLTATLANIGTNQIPALDTFLPEATKTYKSVMLEASFNDGGNATTDFSLGIALTGGTTLGEQTPYRCEQALNTAVYGVARLDLTSALVKNATANVQARSNATASRFSLLALVLVVTYTYDHSASTSVMNSLVLNLGSDTGFAGNTATGDKSRARRSLWIEESNPVLAQSGILATCSDVGNVVLDVRMGAQTSRVYTMTAGSVQNGPYAFSHRVDSGSAAGAFGTLARGKNDLVLDWFSNSSGTCAQFNALLYLNYTSDKHASGDGVHNHSTAWGVCDPTNSFALQQNVASPTALFNIPESSYFVSDVTCDLVGIANQDASSGMTFQAERQSGEGAGAGWETLATCLLRSDGETTQFVYSNSCANVWNRWPSDPDTERMALETTRQYRVCSNGQSTGIVQWLTYHAITYSVAGTVSGSAGGTVTINVYRSSDKVHLGSTSRVGNGAWSFTWYDNTANVFAEMRESSTLLGRTDDGLAA